VFFIDSYSELSSPVHLEFYLNIFGLFPATIYSSEVIPPGSYEFHLEPHYDFVKWGGLPLDSVTLALSTDGVYALHPDCDWCEEVLLINQSKTPTTDF
jgi:hypothetical protein